MPGPERGLTVAEKKVQRTLTEWAQWHGWTVYEFAKKGTHKKLKGSVPTGWPDWLAIRDGQYIHVETKTTTGELSDDQRERIAEIRAAGGTVLVAYGVDDGLRRMVAAGMERSWYGRQDFDLVDGRNVEPGDRL